MQKIAHISDLHIAANNGTHNWRKARIILEEALGAGFDHLIMTGDLVQEPTPENYALARKLLRDFGLLNPDKLSLTIGNHEVYGGVHLAKEIFEFPGRCRRTNYARQVGQFRDYFPEAFENSLTVSPDEIFPYVKIVGDFAIVGINTIAPYSLLRNIAASRGRVAVGEMAKLKTLLRLPQLEGKIKVAITHHHFCERRLYGSSHENTLWGKFESGTIGLRGAGKLIGLLEDNGILMVFHGHVHENSIYERGGLRFINAGGSVDNPGGPHICYNIAQIDRESAEISVRQIPFECPPPIEWPMGVDLIPEFAD